MAADMSNKKYKISREISYKEFEDHDGSNPSNNTLWTLINGEVYDMTSWVNYHPGGASALKMIAGRDATIVIEQYHPFPSVKRKVSHIIEGSKHIRHIGTLKCSQEDLLKIYANDQLFKQDTKSEFYSTLTLKIERYLTVNNIDIHGNITYNILDGLFTFLLYLMTGIAMMYHYTYSFEYIICIFHAFISYHIGLIQHTANHYAYNNKLLNNCISHLMDLSGYDSDMWTIKHNIYHHLLPNVYGYDNDSQTGYPLFRFHPKQRYKKFVHSLQYILIFVLMTLNMVKWFMYELVFAIKFLMDSGFRLRVEFPSGLYINLNSVKPVKIIVSKMFHYFFYFGFKYIIISEAEDRSNTLMIYCFFTAFTGLMLGIVLIVNHLHSEMFVEIDKQNIQNIVHWSEINVVNSGNYSTVNSDWSRFWCFMSGGLNYQIEHHLFPAMNPTVYPKIAPIVRKTAEEFNLQYINYDNIWAALKSTVQHLYDLGRYDHERDAMQNIGKEKKVPSMLQQLFENTKKKQI